MKHRKLIWLLGILCLPALPLLVLPSIPVLPAGAQGTGAMPGPLPGGIVGSLGVQDVTREFDEKIQSFFDFLRGGNTAMAFDTLLQNSPLGAVTASGQITDMRARFEDTKSSLYGDILAWEKHGTKRIGEDIAVVRYILKCENYPMIWTFTFYRKPTTTNLVSVTTGPKATTNSNPWTLIEMRFDSNLDLLAL